MSIVGLVFLDNIEQSLRCVQRQEQIRSIIVNYVMDFALSPQGGGHTAILFIVRSPMCVPDLPESFNKMFYFRTSSF
jgi:hypothetical protein